ncbi:hypothetical protein IC582_007706 [Cucumis melo]
MTTHTIVRSPCIISIASDKTIRFFSCWSRLRFRLVVSLLPHLPHSSEFVVVWGVVGTPRDCRRRQPFLAFL